MDNNTELYTPTNRPSLDFFSLRGKVCIVTGGAGGIGIEVAGGLAEAGADVQVHRSFKRSYTDIGALQIALLYHSRKDAPKKAQAIGEQNNVKCQAYQADLTDPAAVNAVFHSVLHDFGRLDVVVANAGICAFYPAEECSPSEFNSIMSTNLNAVMYCSQAAARAFQKQGLKTGSIIVTASVSGRLVNIPQKQAAYNASKAAVIHLSKSLAVEWVSFCRVNCVSPGYIETELLQIHPESVRARWKSLVPARRNARPYELKGAFVFLASEASSYVTGADLVVDGGYSLV